MKSVIQVRFPAVFYGLLIAAASLMATERGFCQSAPEPAVIISIANIDEQLDDIEYLANAASEEMGQMSGLLKMQARGFTRGIDTTKSAGMMMYFNEDSPQPTTIGFVPLENMDDMLDTLAGFAEIDEGDDIVTIIADSGQEISMKQVGNYAFMSDQPGNLEDVPKDPSKLIGKMAEQYNIAATVYPQRIPEGLRDMAMGLIQQGAEQNMQMLDEIDPVQAEIQQQNFEMQMQQMENLFNDTEEMVLGMAADQKAEAIYFDLVMTAKPGSEMAEQISASKKAGASRFGGFLMDGAAMTANMTSQIAPNQIEQTLSVMKNSKEQIQEMLDANPNMTDAQAEMTEELVDSLLDVVMKTIEDGRMDMGAVMMMNDGEMNFAMGVEAANPKKLEDAVKDVVKMVEKEVGDEVQFNLNAGSHRGTTFHEILVEVPSSEEEAQQIFGDQLTLVIGIAKDAVYFAMGSDPEDVLKQAMDKSAESSDSKADMPMQVNFYLSPILKFASGIQGMEMMEMMSDTLQSGGDRIQIRSEFIDNGTKTRFEIQDGILELLGAAGGMMGGMGGGGADF
ncbi:MAG: hypothetical protein VYE64_08960 [Planctomycetota bacterium]|nr:hypothetical protein [Planctomycetota bacterium]